ncbi:DASS family sodium-coupled anion symporter [Roseibium sp. RKSG952]|uniref:SLC13 family permease n=1 Tax=Roseibium sp. RKSG952 TaxID=2529384 RepID=UPI0012BC5CB3|nr:SLC13 family permease [Roseibium sp. RKSG952]MTH95786.1 SLC13/DASS family transporter [Roseibium sp. RKSG952]
MATDIMRRSTAQTIGLSLGPIIALTLIMIPSGPEMTPVLNMSAVVALMATFWFTEAIPLPATALLPFVLFPVLGIMSATDTAPLYFNSTIFLFLGGFIMAIAMERWNLHKRIALAIIATIGGKPDRIILGFILASGFLSMWISNVATAIMLLPIGLSTIYKLEAKFGEEKAHPFAVSAMLAIAFGSSIGGMATLVGTPPNLALKSIFEGNYPNAPQIAFGQWFAIGLPLAIVMLAFVWILLTRILYKSPDGINITSDEIAEEQRSLGKMGWEELWVLTLFTATALLWTTRQGLDFGFAEIPGWSDLIPQSHMINDGTVAMMMASLLFCIPTRSNKGRSTSSTLVDGSCFQKLPWGVVLLFGGGFALARGFDTSGLAAYLAEQLQLLGSLPPIATVFILSLGMTFVTAFTSNTATTMITLPILSGLSSGFDMNPLLLMIPATLAASCAFMMPVATPPNAVVFGSGRLRITDFIKSGIILNIVGALAITAIMYLVAIPIFGIDVTSAPVWAH